MDATRPSAQSCKYMNDPFPWTASITWVSEVLRTARRRQESQEDAYLRPCGDLLVGPDSGDVKALARSFVRDKGPLINDDGSRCARTRSIVLDGEISVRMLAVPPESGYGCHNHSVLEGDGSNLDGLKKLGSLQGECMFSRFSVSYCTRIGTGRVRDRAGVCEEC